MTASPTEKRVTPTLPLVDQESHAPQRRYRRFRLNYLVTVRFEGENRGSELRALSNNISAAGILLENESAIPQHCGVRFVMTIQEHHIIGPTQIMGEGKVVRVEPRSSGAGFAIA
jgi:c-di-GMP-binding flagellar brake protein YcgR